MKYISHFDCYGATFQFDPPVQVPNSMIIDSLGAIIVGAQAHDHTQPEAITHAQLAADAHHRQIMDNVNLWYRHDLEPLPLIADVLDHELKHRHTVTFVEYRH